MSAVTLVRLKASMRVLGPSSDSAFEFALQAVLVLNLADAVLTSWWVSTGWATEANPLMNQVLELGVGPFLLTKAILGMTAVVILKAHRTHVLSRIGVVAILAVYLGVIGLHVAHGAQRLNEGTLVATADGQSLFPDQVEAPQSHYGTQNLWP